MWSSIGRRWLWQSLAVLAAITVLATTVRAEIADQPKASLAENATIIVVGTCVKIESKVERSGDMENTNWFHHLTIEQIERDGSGRLHVGDTVVFLSASRAWRGIGTPPTYGTGHRGMPTKGERRRVYSPGLASQSPDKAGEVPWLRVAAPNGWQPAARSVVLVGADDEYRSEVSMPLIADCLRRDASVTTTIAFPADPVTRKLDPDRRDHIENLDSLRSADVGVLFLRWRELSGNQWEELASFLKSGQPIVGLRTSTHMIRSKTDAPDRSIDDDVPTRVFGQHWISHHGHESRTRVLAPEGIAATHPVLRGIRGGFEVPSWLYDVEPLPKDCTVLLWGEVIPARGTVNEKPIRQPIVWVRERGESTPTPFPDGGRPARRMAFTTLGHPGDFLEPQVRRLVEQMIVWAAGDETSIPSDGLKAEPSAAYVAPPTR